MVNKQKAEQIYKESLRVLKKVQLANGGCLATPVGERYPYVYPRDHAFCVLAFSSAKKFKEAKKGLNFILKSQLEDGAFPQRVGKKGKDASYKPIQIDGSGLTIYAFCDYVKKSNDLNFAKKHWDSVIRFFSYAKAELDEEKDLIFTPNSVHEFPPTEKGLEIWANGVCSAAFREAYDVSKLINQENKLFLDLANKIKNGIDEYMWNPRVKGYIKNIRLKESSSVITHSDAAALALSEFNVFPVDYDHLRFTIKRIHKELWNKDVGGICRYPKFEGRNNGGWGPWPHFTLMMADYFIFAKNKKKADKYFNWVLKISYKNKLPEHIATVKEFNDYVTDFTEAAILRPDRVTMIKNAQKHPMFKKGLAYVTLPLAWPHAQFIITWNLYKDKFL